MVVQPRNQARSDLLALFERGETPTSLSRSVPKNTLYRWYKIHHLVEMQKEIQKRLLTQDLKPLSQRDCERVLRFLKTGVLE